MSESARLSDIIKVKNIPFVEIRRETLEHFDKFSKLKDTSKYKHFERYVRDLKKPFQTTYVSFYELIEKAKTLYFEKKYNRQQDYCAPLVWQGTVGFMSDSWVNENKSKHSSMGLKFGTGLYKISSQLLLIDDIFEWAHSRIESSKIRSAFDLIVDLQEVYLNDKEEFNKQVKEFYGN